MGLDLLGEIHFVRNAMKPFMKNSYIMYIVVAAYVVYNVHMYAISILYIYKDYISMLGELTCICTYVFHQSHSTKYSYVYTSYPGIFSMNTIQSMVINYILFFSIAILN